MKVSTSQQGLRWRLRQLFGALRSFFSHKKEVSGTDKTPQKLPEASADKVGNGYTIRVNDQEAMLINWLLTMHSYSPEYLDYLMKPGVLQVRHQAGKIITQGAGQLELLEEEIKWLLVILPVTFRLGRGDAGFSLKKKLYEAYLKNKT